MKAFLGLFPLVAAALVVLVLSGCFAVARVSVYTPRYLSFDELRRSVEVSDPVQMSSTGKIYVWESYVFVNELEAGVHVIDNTDSANPAVVAFIPIPGNVDIAIRDGILYADSYVDLVAIDVSDPLVAHEVNRIENAFPYPDPEPLPWIDGSQPVADEEVVETEGIVVGWEEAGSRLLVYDTRPIYAALDASGGAEGGGRSTGTGGSLARFTIVGDYLYALHLDQIRVVDISTPANPQLGDPVQADWDIETIFPFGDVLLVGSMTGMHIFDITDPATPTWLAEFEHITSCDPVVAQGTTAYVTLRAGTRCGGGVNALHILDISDLEDPTRIASYLLEGPYGLGVDFPYLFVCDGIAGLKVFDVTDPLAVRTVTTVSAIQTYDVILMPPVALVVGPDGLRQYDYSGLAGGAQELALLSELEVVPPPDAGDGDSVWGDAGEPAEVTPAPAAG